MVLITDGSGVIEYVNPAFGDEVPSAGIDGEIVQHRLSGCPGLGF